MFGSSFASPSTTSSSIFGSATSSPAFGVKKAPEPAPLPTAFKFGSDKTDSSPAAAASLFGVPPTQNPFGAPASNAAPFAFSANNNQQQQQPQQPPPAYNFSAGSVNSGAAAAPFSFGASQQAPSAGFGGFNAAPQQQNAFQINQQPQAAQPGILLFV
jgi:hypothetical protein